MVEDWTLQVISHRPMETWVQAAQKLRTLLDTISVKVEEAWGTPLVWRDEDLDIEAWRDIACIADEMARQVASNEDGTAIESLGSSGVVQGYKDVSLARNGFTSGAWDVNVSWSFGDVSVPADCKVKFAAANGHMSSLNECRPEWLASLTCGAAKSINADTSRIFTRSLLRALNKSKHQPSFSLGAVSYAPLGLTDSLIPKNLVAFDCEKGDSTAKVVVANLQRSVQEPAIVVDDLLKLEPLIIMRAH